MRFDIDALEVMPSRVSIRKGALKEFGGDLNDLYDSPRFDSYRRSRDAYHNSHKDHREHTVSNVRNARRQLRLMMGKE